MHPDPYVVNSKIVLYGTAMERGDQNNAKPACGVPVRAGPACAAPQRGRREARREERREAILDVAQRSFLEHGYAGTTMSGIAGELGGSKGTLWSYFPSKEVLFGAVLDRATRAFRAEMRLTLNADEAVGAALGKFCLGFITKLFSPEAIGLHRLVTGEAGRFPEMGRIFYERAPMPTLRLMAEYLGGAMERGLLRRDDPFHAAQYLVALCTARTHQRLLAGVEPAPGADTIAADAASAVDLFLRAYRPD